MIVASKHSLVMNKVWVTRISGNSAWDVPKTHGNYHISNREVHDFRMENFLPWHYLILTFHRTLYHMLFLRPVHTVSSHLCRLNVVKEIRTWRREQPKAPPLNEIIHEWAMSSCVGTCCLWIPAHYQKYGRCSWPSCPCSWDTGISSWGSSWTDRMPNIRSNARPRRKMRNHEMIVTTKEVRTHPDSE